MTDQVNCRFTQQGKGDGDSLLGLFPMAIYKAIDGTLFIERIHGRICWMDAGPRLSCTRSLTTRTKIGHLASEERHWKRNDLRDTLLSPAE